MRFLFGLIGIVAGVLIIWKTFPLVGTFGRVDWAERHLSGGFGGTYFLYKAVGFILILLSAMYWFGILDVLLSPFANMFGGIQ
ncbi:MAG: hypothetical protein Q8P75_00035 [bacterium]|nr:hypothetical protein [bacterium]